ncbi:hypothetical protein Pmani_026358 [Petrolisthes manimaculis]|uniref:Transposase n=1 Tax=Petrolisthes manimaculis TaxID=1843537 RepID=A0AAE1U091_9EUCA|nr:hypothetical protein Pmani_026358 [Petrolisthes manimaculis]
MRLSSAHYAQSNGCVKRLLRGNISRGGSMDTDGVARALIQYLNTPLGNVDASPAQLLTGRQLRDAIPVESYRYLISEQWGKMLREQERAMSRSAANASLSHNQSAHDPTPLEPGQRQPSRPTYFSVERRLREYDSLNARAVNRGRPHGEQVLDAEEDILDAIADDPSTSTRRLGARFDNVYTRFLQDDLPILLEDVPLKTRRQMWFMQDGSSAHFARGTRDIINFMYPDKWIGRGGPIAWPPRSPDLTPLDFYLWGHLKSRVYATQINICQELWKLVQEACREIRNTPGIF